MPKSQDLFQGHQAQRNTSLFGLVSFRTEFNRMGTMEGELTGTLQSHPPFSHSSASFEIWIATWRSRLSRRVHFYWVSTFSLPCIFLVAVYIYISPGSPWAACQLNEAVINVDTCLCAYCVHTAVTGRLLHAPWQHIRATMEERRQLRPQCFEVAFSAQTGRYFKNRLGRSSVHAPTSTCTVCLLFNSLITLWMQWLWGHPWLAQFIPQPCQRAI